MWLAFQYCFTRTLKLLWGNQGFTQMHHDLMGLP